MSTKNPNCDKDRCISSTGDTRKLPTGKDGSNMIVCLPCFNHEIQWRRYQNKDLDADCQYPIPKWDDLEIYHRETRLEYIQRLETDAQEAMISAPDEYVPEEFHQLLQLMRSAVMVADYIWDNPNEYRDYEDQGFENGSFPQKDHVLYHAAVVLGHEDKLPTRIR